MKASTIINFVVDYRGTPQPCFREIVGTKVLRQTITVPGCGSKQDDARYANKRGHPITSMGFAAQMIAFEIIDAYALRSAA